jgi:hypothetical protein
MKTEKLHINNASDKLLEFAHKLQEDKEESKKKLLAKKSIYF